MLPMDIGRTVVMFRHPRTRFASHCRQKFSSTYPKAKGRIVFEHDDLYRLCIKNHLQGNHVGLMTRMVAGVSCGGPILCNSAKYLMPSLTSSMVATALDRISSRYLIYLGITDEWNPSVLLFHAMLMPEIPVYKEELKNMHTSFRGRPSRANLRFQEESFANMREANFGSKGPWLRDRFDFDPDLLIYAKVRQLFCANYYKYVLSEEQDFGIDVSAITGQAGAPGRVPLLSLLPSECQKSIGVLPGPLDTKPDKPANFKAGKALLMRWNASNRRDLDVGILNGRRLYLKDLEID